MSLFAIFSTGKLFASLLGGAEWRPTFKKPNLELLKEHGGRPRGPKHMKPILEFLSESPVVERGNKDTHPKSALCVLTRISRSFFSHT